MSEARRCGHCAAVVKHGADAAFCAFCGAELPPVPVQSPPSRHDELEARFDALLAHPALERAKRKRPSGARVQAGNGLRTVFGLVFAAVGGTIGLAALGNGAPGFFALIPLVFVGFGLWMAIKSAGKAASFAGARLRHLPALVAGERTEVSGGGQNSSATTTYFATIEFATGRRDEYEVHARLSGRLAPGDMGIAFIRGGHLLDFDRVAV